MVVVTADDDYHRAEDWLILLGISGAGEWARTIDLLITNRRQLDTGGPK